MSSEATKWARTGLLYLTVSFLAVGLWATVDPRGFYDDFPGGGRHWIAGDGPYNAHLVGDTGVGFLAVGLVLLLATVWMDKRVVQAGLLAAIVHGVPHLLFHLRHPNEALSDFDTLASNGSLAFGTIIALVVLVSVSRSPRRARPVNPSDGSGAPAEAAATRSMV